VFQSCILLIVLTNLNATGQCKNNHDD
jgi:hypothetical protein